MNQLQNLVMNQIKKTNFKVLALFFLCDKTSQPHYKERKKNEQTHKTIFPASYKINTIP